MNLTTHRETLSPAFNKLHIEGLPFNASFNHFTEPDTGDPHDHPFNFVTHIIKGSYIERIYDTRGNFYTITRTLGSFHYVSADTIHKIIKIPEGECYTLMIPELKIREPRFWRFENGKAYSRQWNEEEFKLYEINK